MSESFEIKRAERRHARLRFAVCGPSNGGKTWTSIEVAFGIAEELIASGVLAGTLEGKVGMIDTERRSGHLYSHLGPYDLIELAPPYSVERYVAAMRQLERSGVSVLIIDSISHAWVGDGGVLSLLDRFTPGERFSAFGSEVNPAQDAFVDAMLSSPCHVIATMRSKTSWVLEDRQNRHGHQVKAPKRIGLAPVQRPGIEYEFTTMIELDADSHFARVVKNRCPVFREASGLEWVPKRISREHGRALASWLLEGAPEAPPPVSGTPLERAIACRDAALRAMDRAENRPDLERVLADANVAIRAFDGAVDAANMAAIRRAVAQKKDERKVALGGAPAPSGGLEPRLAHDIEVYAAACGVKLEEVREHFEVRMLAHLDPARLQLVCGWIHKEGLERVGEVKLPASLVAAGVVLEAPADGLARFADDRPF